jgi:hypothetical protein
MPLDFSTRLPVRLTVYWISLVAILAWSRTTSAGNFVVSLTEFGTETTTGSLAWAINQANSTLGHDTITINAGLEISVDHAEPIPVEHNWLARLTESVAIFGNGSRLVGNPTYVTSGGLIATKTNILGNVYSDPFHPTDVVVTRSFSFAQIGTIHADNSHIHVEISNLGADGLASFAVANEGSTLTTTGGSFTNMVNYTGYSGRAVFDARTGSTLNLDGISISSHIPFTAPFDITDEYSAFFGTIGGSDSQLNLQNSSIQDSFGAGALSWSGGVANVVSSVFSNAGGLSVVDGRDGNGDKTMDGRLNFVNSILYMQGGDNLSETNRIQAASGGEAWIVASSILYNAIATDSSSDVAYALNGMPLTATYDGVLRFNSSVVVPLNADLMFPGKTSYSEFNTGNLLADDFSYIAATDTQPGDAIKTLFGNNNILTGGKTFNFTSGDPVSVFDPLPWGATPSQQSVLIGVVPDAGPGGANQLINPINGQPILFDVYGHSRTHNGRRDIGAVQAIPEPSTWILCMAGFAGCCFSRRWRSAAGMVGKS